MSVNKVFLVGKLSSDTDQNYTASGTAVCRFTLETVENFKDKRGVKQERIESHNIVAWAELADFCEKSLDRGKQVYIEGRIQRKTIDEDGNKSYLTEIVANKIEALETQITDGSDNGDLDNEIFDPDAVPF